MRPCPNAQLVIDSSDRTVYTTSSATTSSQPYSDFLLANPGQNLIQGSIHKVQVAEINFPYDIPNIIAGITDSFIVSIDGPVLDPKTVTIPAGFYTGVDLAVEIQSAMNAVWAAEYPAQPVPGISYDDVNQTFTFQLGAGGAGNTYVFLAGTTAIITVPVSNQTKSVPKSLFTVMGIVPANPDTTTKSNLQFLLAPSSSQT